MATGDDKAATLSSADEAGRDSSGTAKKKVALITGITGQDGTFLAELLLSKGYEVHGVTGIRRAATFNRHHIAHLYEDPTLEATGGQFRIHYGDLTDSSALTNIIGEVRPNEIYNLAAQSNVKESFTLGEYTTNVDALGTLRMLNAIRANKLESHVRFYQASSSELYGKVQERPQTEKTPFHPTSPYGCAKLYAYWIVLNYREAYNMYACNGILFNHESPRRGESFVTRKITQTVARISLGHQQCMELGNLDANRDWGHAKDYVQAMYLMLQQDKADDYVISTGVSHTVRDFVDAAFKRVNIKIQWEGTGVDEIGKDSATGIVRVKVNPRFYRPTDVDSPLGDSTKAKTNLGWTPQYNFEMLVTEMVENDLMLEAKHSAK